MTPFSSPKETEKFFEILGRQLSKDKVESKEINVRNFDYYLSLAGALIGTFIFGGLIPAVILGSLGYLIGFLVNKFFK